MALDLRSIDKKQVLLFIVAIGLALLAAVLSINWIEDSSKKKAAQLAGQMESPKIKELAGRIDNLEQQNQALAQRQNALMQATQEQAASRASTPARQASLSFKMPAGKRAITVTIDRLAAVGGLVSPGDSVDIIVHLATPSDTQQKSSTTTVTLFQNILILAVGSNTEAGVKTDEQRAASLPITLALSPQEAELMSFAQQHGTLQLVLRSPSETESYVLPPATWQSLSQYIKSTQGTDLGVDSTSKLVIPENPIEVFRGGR